MDNTCGVINFVAEGLLY